jgi:large subunit ribosomal protein L24
MQKIKQGDEVIVVTGKDKGRVGRVSKVLASDGKVVVDGVNVVKKHQRGNPNAGVSGGIVDKNLAIDVSNVALFNPKTKKGDRVGIRTLDDGKKVRIFKSTGEQVES